MYTLTQIENSLTLQEVFTEVDDSIFSDSSIDPMGLRIIWTSLGNRVFGSKLNTVSTDIRYYTLNLFHHSIINRCKKLHEDKFLYLVGKPPYNNEEDLYDGIIIFLESFMMHCLHDKNSVMNSEKIADVPGMSKLRREIQKGTKSKITDFIEVNRAEGILVRQHLLGIHGRHKSPFREMAIFKGNDYYKDKEIWKQAEELFSTEPWKQAYDALTTLVTEKILKPKKNNDQHIRLKVRDLPIEHLSKLYMQILKPSNFSSSTIVEFWESKLGLKQNAATILYEQLKIEINKQPNTHPDFSKIIRQAKGKAAIIDAICAIEPILAFYDKLTSKLFNNKTHHINDAKTMVKAWREANFIHIEETKKFRNHAYLDESALIRLNELINIYIVDTEEELIRKAIEYHHTLMNSRTSIPWLNVSPTGDIKHNRSYHLTTEFIESLNQPEWVNTYYLPTVYNLYKGLYH
jgi:hypothetical protein